MTAGIMFRSALTFVHLHLWRRLPHKARRAVLFRLAFWWAPRPTSTAKAKAPIIIIGMLRHASGLGAAARACHDALKAAGLPVYGVDLTAKLMHEVNHTDFDYADGRHLLGEGTVFLHVSGPLVPLAMGQLGRAFVRHKHFIAHWFWELPRLPEDWSPAIPFLHEICVNTTFVRDAVRPIARGRPLHVVPYPLIWTGDPRLRFSQERPFTVSVIFNVASSFARKNPCAAIAAFRQAFGDDPSARLIVKYMNAFAWPEGVRLLEEAAGGAGNIELIGDVLDESGMSALYKRTDVVISLHRAEGLGLPIAEGMMRGLPVVATAWSGSVDFLTPETGVPVSFELVPVKDPQGKYTDSELLWAEADVGEAAAALRMLRSDPVLRQRLGAAAAAHAARYFLPSRYARQVVESILWQPKSIEVSSSKPEIIS
ncbi:glycosyltransferase family 4 protein [Microvirga subterranea]|uniref:Glycosyltransferase involved in cell wall biosynthesis n=1 Tax=Microvirga subterranea TaxID=186651 RepID=A0A370HIW4_9HYPH|nr:glycosyltransferase family 4 protein [Microvirga subterranea]RDI58536.1 glycosyltransferase involved in cell wall biosynthesis [Microvirga subterranea]